MPPYYVGVRRRRRSDRTGGDTDEQSPVGVRCRAGAELSSDRRVFDGWIAGLGTSEGTRVVIGRWTSSPWGPFVDAMVERSDGHRVLLAPTVQVADFVATTYRFDEVQVVPVRLSARPRTWDLIAGPLTAGLEVGGPTIEGRALGILPRALVRSRAFAVAADPVVRLVMPGVRTRGRRTAGGPRRTPPRRATRSSPRAFAGRASTWACSRTSSRPCGSASRRPRGGPASPASARSSAAERASWSGSPAGRHGEGNGVRTALGSSGAREGAPRTPERRTTRAPHPHGRLTASRAHRHHRHPHGLGGPAARSRRGRLRGPAGRVGHRPGRHPRRGRRARSARRVRAAGDR